MAHHGGGVFWIFDKAWLIPGMSSMLTYSYINNEQEILVFCVIVDMIIITLDN